MQKNKEEKTVNILGIIERTLNYVDARLMDHGNRVAYIVYKVLERQKLFNDKELSDICILALLHDVGAYKTEEIDKMVEFETVDVWEHSIYGYLFLKYFSPLNELAPIILYHHADCNEVKKLKDTTQQMLAQLISLCDRADVFIRRNGKADEFMQFANKNRDIKYRSDIIDMYIESGVDIDSIFDNAAPDEEFERIFHGIPLTDDEISKYINTFIYSIDFRSNQTVIHTVSTICIAETLAGLLNVTDEDELDKIRLAAVLHDIGKIGIPVNILESSDRYTAAEMEIMKNHVNITDKILEGNVSDEVRRIAANHHEKLNGTGYPKGLDASEIHMYDRIVAISDIISALCRERNYKQAYPKERVVAVLEDMSGQHFIDPDITDLAVRHINEILDNIETDSRPVMQVYTALNYEYEKIRDDILG